LVHVQDIGAVGLTVEQARELVGAILDAVNELDWVDTVSPHKGFNATIQSTLRIDLDELDEAIIADDDCSRNGCGDVI
jgi:hypothetical protein